MKYIPADKLITEIEKRKVILDKYKDSFETAACCKQELEWMEDFISSLQQEQPDIKSHIENLLKECADNPGEYYRGHREALAHLFYYLGGNPAKYLHFIEQPEVDLDKELDNFITEHDDWDDDNKLARDIARHFYELGLNSKNHD